MSRESRRAAELGKGKGVRTAHPRPAVRGLVAGGGREARGVGPVEAQDAWVKKVLTEYPKIDEIPDLDSYIHIN